MHYDPLISSRAKSLVSWGHDWVVLTLIVAFPAWAPSKVFALPIAMRLYRNRQGLTKGKKNPKGKKGQKKSTKPKHDPNHRTRPELALELIIMVAQWFPNEEIIVSGDSAYGGQSILSHLPPNVHLISHVHPKGALYEPASPKKEKRKGPARKKGDRLPAMKQWADDPDRPWTKLKFNQFGLHATLAVKTIQALYYKAGKDRLLTIVLTRDLEGKRPDQMFYCTKLDWTPRQILSAYACRWAIECTFENCKQFLGLEDPANRLPKAVADRADGVVHLQSGGRLVSQVGTSVATFSLPTLVPEEGRAIVCRHVDDPEAGQLRGKNATTASKTVWPENLDRPAHRASQPNRVSDTSAGDPGLQHLSTIDSPGGISPAGPLANRLGICET